MLWYISNCWGTNFILLKLNIESANFCKKKRLWLVLSGSTNYLSFVFQVWGMLKNENECYLLNNVTIRKKEKWKEVAKMQRKRLRNFVAGLLAVAMLAFPSAVSNAASKGQTFYNK